MINGPGTAGTVTFNAGQTKVEADVVYLTLPGPAPGSAYGLGPGTTAHVYIYDGPPYTLHEIYDQNAEEQAGTPLDSEVFAINDLADPYIIGAARGADGVVRARLWRAPNLASPVPSYFADNSRFFSISSAGGPNGTPVWVGGYSNAPFSAIRGWLNEAQLPGSVLLASPSSGFAIARGILRSGMTAAGVDLINGMEQAVIWNQPTPWAPGGTWNTDVWTRRELGYLSPPATGFKSQALGISTLGFPYAAGQTAVVGYSSKTIPAGVTSRGFRHVTSDLSNPGTLLATDTLEPFVNIGIAGVTSRATSVNASGTTVGSDRDSELTRSVIWNPGANPIRLPEVSVPELGVQFVEHELCAICSLNPAFAGAPVVAVGTTWKDIPGVPERQYRAIAKRSSEPVVWPLSDPHSTHGSLSGLVLEEAIGINQDGHIVGVGRRQFGSTLVRRGWLLQASVPHP